MNIHASCCPRPIYLLLSYLNVERFRISSNFRLFDLIFRTLLLPRLVHLVYLVNSKSFLRQLVDRLFMHLTMLVPLAILLHLQLSPDILPRKLIVFISSSLQLEALKSI